MPYESNDKLPDSVKSVLPEKAQDIFRNAFNSSFDEFGEERSMQIAWAAVKNAGYEKKEDGKWVKVSKNTITFDAEIFSAGKWNGDNYTVEDLHEMVKANKELAETVKPPLKLGHNEKQPMKDGMFSLGWVKPGSVRVVGKKLMATFVQVPDILKRAIKKGLYKRISSEIYWNYRHEGKTYKRVLAAVAILGADTPAVGNLADLEKYLSQAPDSGSFELMRSYSMDVDESGEIVNHKKEEDEKMSEQELKDYKAKVKALEQENADLKENGQTADEQIKKYKEQSKKDADALKKFKEEQAAKVRKENEETFKQYVESQVKEGKITPASRDILVKDMNVLCYSEEDGHTITFDQFKAFMKNQGKLIPEKELGEGGEYHQYASVQEEVDGKAKAYARKNDVTYIEALEEVLDSDPALAKKYTEDTSIDYDSN